MIRKKAGLKIREIIFSESWAIRGEKIKTQNNEHEILRVTD